MQIYPKTSKNGVKIKGNTWNFEENISFKENQNFKKMLKWEKMQKIGKIMGICTKKQNELRKIENCAKKCEESAKNVKLIPPAQIKALCPWRRGVEGQPLLNLVV